MSMPPPPIPPPPSGPPATPGKKAPSAAAKGCAAVAVLAVVIAVIVAVVSSMSGGQSTSSSPSSPTPSGPPTPTPPPKPSSPPTAAPAPIVLTADGDKTTPPFHIAADSWTIAYTVTASDCSAALASIFAYPKGESTSFAASADKTGCGSDSTEAQGSGDFYLHFVVANAHVRVVITQH